jgi:hypothetical protein
MPEDDFTERFATHNNTTHDLLLNRLIHPLGLPIHPANFLRRI